MLESFCDQSRRKLTLSFESPRQLPRRNGHQSVSIHLVGIAECCLFFYRFYFALIMKCRRCSLVCLDFLFNECWEKTTRCCLLMSGRSFAKKYTFCSKQRCLADNSEFIQFFILVRNSLWVRNRETNTESFLGFSTNPLDRSCSVWESLRFFKCSLASH